MAAIVVKGVRPTKKADVPPPLYLTTTGPSPSYCHTCGRLVGPSSLYVRQLHKLTRSQGTHKLKSAASTHTSARYCSAKCKRHRPGALDLAIEGALHALLSDLPLSEAAAMAAGLHPELPRADAALPGDTRSRPAKKGDGRLLVPASLLEALVFERESSVSRGQQRRRGRRIAAAAEEEEERDGEGSDGYDEEALRAALARLAGKAGEAARGKAAGAGGGTEDEDEGLEAEEVDGEADHGAEQVVKRSEGQQRAAERERVRNACRRAVVFGLESPSDAGQAGLQDEKKQKQSKGGKGRRRRDEEDEDPMYGKEDAEHRPRRRCECVMRGAVVEPSYAKGDWGVRWAEDSSVV